MIDLFALFVVGLQAAWALLYRLSSSEKMKQAIRKDRLGCNT